MLSQPLLVFLIVAEEGSFTQAAKSSWSHQHLS